MTPEAADRLLEAWLLARRRCDAFRQITRLIEPLGLIEEGRTPAGDLWKAADGLARQYHAEAEELEQRVRDALARGRG